MKTKTPSGTVFVKSVPRFQRFQNFIPWHQNSAGDLEINWNYCASGQAVGFLYGQLVDGKFYYWPILFLNYDTGLTSWFASKQSWPSPNGRVGFTGEWFNGSQRSLVFDKVSEARWNDWVDSH